MAIIDDVGLLCLMIDGNANKEIIGRTRLQKIGYFCRYLDWNIRDYRLHYYGPFSLALADTVETAESIKLISQSADTPHRLRLTGKGEDLVRKFEDNVCDPTKVKKTRDLVKLLSGWEIKELELAATIDFVGRNERDLAKAKLLDKVGMIKKNFSPKQIQDAYKKWKEIMASIGNA